MTVRNLCIDCSVITHFYSVAFAPYVLLLLFSLISRATSKFQSDSGSGSTEKIATLKPVW